MRKPPLALIIIPTLLNPNRDVIPFLIPLGMQLAGKDGAEETLFGLAKLFETFELAKEKP